MGRKLDYEKAQEALSNEFARAEDEYRAGELVKVPKKISKSSEELFRSSTQAFREALIGCALARILDPQIDIRLPYMNQADNAYNGRTLCETVVTPFLQDRAIPCSKGPFLSALRRNVSFVPDTAKGIRDKVAYSGLLSFIGELSTARPEQAHTYLRYLLYGFIRLRDEAEIQLSRVKRLSLDQYSVLVGRLLQTPSGGRLPLLLCVAMFETIKRSFNLDWEIISLGINVADTAAGTGGDITIKRDGSPVLTVEITEREIDRARVVSTFNTKISPLGLDDYIFFFTASPPTEDARAATRQYFSQGHDINFLSIQEWLVNCLGTIGARNRQVFMDEFLKLISGPGVPSGLKVTWNDIIKELIS